MKWKDRKAVQKAHEQFTVELFLEWFNHQHKSKFNIIAEPNPPDAVIRSGRTVRWLEVTAVYWNDTFARDLCSYVTEGEQHKPINGNVFVNPTAEFIGRFIDILKKKLEKDSYIACMNEYGPGYLLVSLQFPWFSSNTLDRMKRSWANSSRNDKNCFRSIYLIHRIFGGEYGVTRW